MNKLWYVCIITLGFACSKTESTSVPLGADVVVSVKHRVKGVPVRWDSVMYVNSSGNHYSVERLEYYLSDITLLGEAGYSKEASFYVDAEKGDATIQLKGLAEGKYSLLSFWIGLAPQKNVSGALPNNLQNLGMAWPDMMGGGYHFLKLEGHFSDTTPDIYGYGMHVGTNPAAMQVFVPINIKIGPGSNKLDLAMEIDRWFDGPRSFDLAGGGNYTMGNDSLMKVIAENGSHVFVVR